MGRSLAVEFVAADDLSDSLAAVQELSRNGQNRAPDGFTLPRGSERGKRFLFWNQRLTRFLYLFLYLMNRSMGSHGARKWLR